MKRKKMSREDALGIDFAARVFGAPEPGDKVSTSFTPAELREARQVLSKKRGLLSRLFGL